MKRFTLIELLVSVAIIGILMSILLPSLNKAREATKSAVCKSNQHQYYLAVITYSDESDGYVPVVRNKNVAYMYDTSTADGIDYLNSFVKAFSLDSGVLACPSSPMKSKFEGTTKFRSNLNFFTGVEIWANNYGNVTSESPLNVSTTENKWMLITDKTYKDNFDSADDYQNHGEFKKGNNQTSMDGATKFYSQSGLRFFHSHWKARREYYFYQDSEVNAKKYIPTTF